MQRTISTSILSITLASLALSHAGCTADLHVESDPDEQTAEESAALTTAMTTTTAGGALDNTSGNKIIAGRDGLLHAVYADSGAIKYIKSSDGIAWSSPATLAPASTSTPAARPVIAEDGAGTLGVAYVKGGTLFYTSRQLAKQPPVSKLDWSAPIQVTSDTSSQSVQGNPSMVGFGTTMHIAWTKAHYIRYAALASTATGPVATSQVANDTNVPLCYVSRRADTPSIAVAQASAGSSTPIVRIAYFDDEYPDDFASPCGSYFGPMVSQRGSDGSWSVAWSGRVEVAYGSWNTVSGVSMSLAALPATGDFYLAFSRVGPGIEGTELYHQNAWTTGQWLGTGLVPRRSLVHVATGYEDCKSLFRVALTDYTMGDGTYGPTWYQAGQWTGTANSPAWVGAPVTVSSSGRHAEAVFWRAWFGPKHSSGYTRRVPTVFEQLVGSAYSIANESGTTPGWSGFLPCHEKQAAVN